MLIDVRAACALLKSHDNILILTHQKPDGDTLGASFALLWALEALGKKVRVHCTDGFPARYDFIYGEYTPDESFEALYLVAVDIASLPLIGSNFEIYEGKIDLCIDHHKSNTMYAKQTLLDETAPAASQIMYEILLELGAAIDKRIADALFTGLSTDTGCFKYSNVTSKTHRAAADMIDFGADHSKINKLMFDTKSRGILKIDRLMLETISFYFDNRCALIVLPVDITTKYGVSEEELDGISAFPVRIEGVMAGITVRIKPDDTYRISIRTVSPVDASRICSLFNGGGHMNAAGCTMSGDIDDIINKILAAVEEELEQKLY